MAVEHSDEGIYSCDLHNAKKWCNVYHHRKWTHVSEFKP